jgi:hypothetical protein
MMNDEDPQRKEALESVAGSTLPTRDPATRLFAPESEAFQRVAPTFTGLVQSGIELHQETRLGM